jgi:peroxiredoxin
VIALVVAAIWADRDRIEPVPGYGVVPQPGASEVVTLTAPLKVGDTAPNFRLRTTDGEALELADLRGQPVVIQFWTTWCIECTSELPTLQNLAGKYDGRAHVLGIDVGEQADRAEDAAREYGVTYPVALDADEEVSRHYGAYTLPTVIVIDANGVITSLASGSIPMDSLAPQLDALVST